MQAFFKKIIKSDISGEPLKHGPMALKFWLIAAFMPERPEHASVLIIAGLPLSTFSTFSTCK